MVNLVEDQSARHVLLCSGWFPSIMAETEQFERREMLKQTHCRVGGIFWTHLRFCQSVSSMNYINLDGLLYTLRLTSVLDFISYVYFKIDGDVYLEDIIKCGKENHQ